MSMLMLICIVICMLILMLMFMLLLLMAMLMHILILIPCLNLTVPMEVYPSEDKLHSRKPTLDASTSTLLRVKDAIPT